MECNVLDPPCPNPADVLAEIRQEVDITPATPDRGSLIPKLPSLGRPLKVASPCCGIHGCSHALAAMGVDQQSIAVYDLDEDYAYCLWKHLKQIGMSRIRLHLGKVAGNLLNLPIRKLPVPLDILVAGPPCAPWAAQGCRKSHQDERAKVFFRILHWVYYLVKAGGLLAVVLETVVGINHRVDNREPVMDMFLIILREFLPEFAWRVDTLRLTEYMIPHTRVRVFLRGVRRRVADTVPDPLPPFGSRPLREILGEFPCTPRSALTPPQQENLVAYERHIMRLAEEGKVKPEDIIVFPVDRAENRTFKQNMTINNCPTLTTTNQYLFVADVGSIISGLPDSDRKHFRKLKNTERLALQGGLCLFNTPCPSHALDSVLVPCGSPGLPMRFNKLRTGFD